MLHGWLIFAVTDAYLVTVQTVLVPGDDKDAVKETIVTKWQQPTHLLRVGCYQPLYPAKCFEEEEELEVQRDQVVVSTLSAPKQVSR